MLLRRPVPEIVVSGGQYVLTEVICGLAMCQMVRFGVFVPLTG
ncbi:hypothetical protein MPNT_230001 [Candidatus Methylacidithermus pantelleriae]|uniref:Uncharacterized protein n=1 Tax=Candidatus Methylacidithermus pantelleriae TaxID=2744239 RepID=A0A8J2BLX0_9BACT|nr:hypothetical protein MPNT_230001 [Candidatus Methylacidithermus pantelleriae]